MYLITAGALGGLGLLLLKFGASPSPPKPLVVVVPGGGLTRDGLPSLWVRRRLVEAADVYFDRTKSGEKVVVVTLSGGTPHKPMPLDPHSGYQVYEAEASARWLVREHKVPAQDIYEENWSLDTIANAFFLRTTHTDPAGWNRLLVISNAFHMPRTREIFLKVFDLPPLQNGKYSLDFREVPDEGVEPVVLESRRAREAKSLANFREKSISIASMQQMHDFLFQEHMAYASKRLMKDQMWGDGKMIWPSGEEYIGSLKKGVFHGKGTRTWPNGDRYAGSFKHGMQDGEGTFESAEEGWVYNGQWLQNRMNGRGKVKWPNGIEYDGDWKDGIREGKGKLTWADGSSYKGEFQHNCIEGKGKKTLPDGSWFEGQFHDSELEGRGTFHWPDGTEFEGLWHNSEIVGPGCHRFPNGTMITGVFENHGATGEGTKKWANGCMYTGTLLNNSIHKYGVFQWSDGRRYIGQFQDEMMHGEGMLCWSDDFGVCRYKGTFEHNVFQGHGVLEWSVKARYVGEFFNGLYHGEGTFEWPDKANVYRGQWQFGEMSGKGTLTTSCGSVCSGEFHAGNMEGRGTITFITNDQYTGEFKDSMFNGLGCYTWSSGVTLTGVFENNVCSKVGKKTYTNGLVYVGELFEDQEHGRGVLTDANGTRIVGVWNNGRLEEELVEMMVSGTEVDPRGPTEQRVFIASRKPEVQPGTLVDSLTDKEQCKTIVIFANGDKYVGGLQNAQKEGDGMYVYADGSAYKGTWSGDSLDGEVHPQGTEAESSQTGKLHDLNVRNTEAVAVMKTKLPGERKQAPLVAKIQE